MAQISFTVSAVTGRVVRIPLIPEKSGYRGIRSENDRSTVTAVAAVWLAFGFASHPHKRNNPRTTVAGAEVDSDSVDKHDR
jgi:hypothetical protein